MKQINIDLFDERFYEVKKGVFYPSVTYMLGVAYPKSKQLIEWRGQVGNQEADLAMRNGCTVGSYVHESIETMILKGKTFKTVDILKDIVNEKNPIKIKILKSLTSFVAFWNEYQPKVVKCEYKVSSDELKLAGTVDGKYRLNIDDYETVWGLDWKTSKNIHDSSLVQLSLYGEMDKEIENIAIVHLGNTTKKGFSFKEIDQSKGFLEQGISVNKTFQSMHPNARPSTNVFPEEFKISINK